MKLPIHWIEKYVKLEHKIEDIGDILTKLDTMQDGPIQYVDKKPVLNLEIRQNRPDLLSILGLAREYAAFTDQDLIMPEIWEDTELRWNKPDKLLNIEATDIVKRFTVVEIKNIKIDKSPDWIVNALKEYGIPSINNIVDITNYVMLELGIPMHAFDFNKLKAEKDESLLTLRRAKSGEPFETWLKTKLKLNKDDLIVADTEKIVGVGGIIGGLNSGITDNTKNILLEAANYEQKYIRATARRHNIFTESSTRHEKFLNSNMVELAVRRAIYLILELAGGEVKYIEDYYENKEEDKIIDLNLYEVERLSGLELSADKSEDYLRRLGYTILDFKESDALMSKNIKVKVPDFRTDIEMEEDLVEEILRLHGYENIPYQEINLAPPKDITPDVLKFEEKIRDILVSLSLDEHIISPLVKYNEKNTNQIKLENSLNSDLNALRNNIFETLEKVKENYIKNGIYKFGVFEIGKIYLQTKIGEYKEERRIGVLYNEYKYTEKVKGDFILLLKKLGLNLKNISFKEDKGELNVKYLNGHEVNLGILNSDKFEIYTQNFVELVDLQKVPYIFTQSNFVQRIVDEFSIVYDKDTSLGDITSLILNTSENIEDVIFVEEYKGKQIKENEKSALIRVTFADPENKLTRNEVHKIRDEFLDKIKSKFSIKLR